MTDHVKERLHNLREHLIEDRAHLVVGALLGSLDDEAETRECIRVAEIEIAELERDSA